MGYDAYTHTSIANLISITGFVPPFEISGKYVNYPILHIFISMTKILSFIDIKNAVFFSIGLISIICLLFVFILVNRFAGPRIGLLSVLIISMSNDIITTGITNITAGSLVFCYFTMILYLFLCQKSDSRIFICILFLITETMVITHQLSTFVVLLSVVLLKISFQLYKFGFESEEKDPIFLLYLYFFAISMIAYWMSTPAYHQQSFFETILAPFIAVLEFGGKYGSDVLIVGHEYVRPVFDTLLLQASYLIIPFFAIGGIYLWLSKKDAKMFSIAFSAAVLFFIIYAVPFFGIRNLLTDRWMPFLLIFLGILAAAYIISCVDLIKSNISKIVTLFIIIAIFSFFMLVTPAINKDNPLVAKDTTARNQYTDSEIHSIEQIVSVSQHDIIVDRSFFGGILFYGNNNTIDNQIELTKRVSTFDSEKNLMVLSKNQNVLVILRKSTLHEPISQKASDLYGDTMVKSLSKDIFIFFESSGFNKIYTDGNVISYIFY
jgi:hypothetical protein